ncbi:Peptidase S28 [Cordyceps fumosorosea ARSEF 2679]|uniref:Peptidase S28 n=1 Tax=Cordyceps fumosorosea (strain ARSEF 2679) TaxID=1081104 RepID=A0A167T1C7_CORFA|nr:Peptidase S28 [Cordyceps fumosorosea ARSEF 2679]OAA60147.1 Peptidase S28 [Cordyceps fumosorosea ARSEF 2679]
MHLSFLTAVLGLTAAGAASVFKPVKPMRSMKTMAEITGAAANTGDVKQSWFDQLIDHSNPSLGTFKQRYYYSTAYYNGPGSPVSLDAPSEAALPPSRVDLSNATMPGFIAQNLAGAAIALEHRFYGESTPIGSGSTPNTQTLQPLTLENAIDDLVYFARNVKLPFDPDGLSHPDRAPWTLSGCSYSGALSAWTERLAPGTFWAYEAGSAVVEARDDLWQYYGVIGEALPQNCSADWKLVMAHIDDVLMNGSDGDKADLKRNLGVVGASDQNAAESAASWVSSWQSQQYFYGYTRPFQVCDYIENQLPEQYEPTPGAQGLGLDKALQGFFRYMQAGSGSSSPQDNSFDPWLWQLCNEPFEWWQTERAGTPLHMTTGYDTEESQRNETCSLFPDVGNYKVGVKLGRNADTVNKLTGGWGVTNTTRLAWVNAEFDPWLYATVSSPDRPGGALQSTADAPVYWLRGTAHCNDYLTGNYAVNDDARAMFDGVAANMKQWADDFYKQHNITRPQ